MLRRIIIVSIVLLSATPAWGQAIWQRRDPKTAYLFHDYRARQLGDLLTLVVNESTESENLEKREMDKQTKTSANYGFSGKTTSPGTSRSFAAEFDGAGNSQRKFDGKNNSTIDRKFIDRMTVTVVGVLPNGNLIIDGARQRIVQREVRTLRVTGIVRPADIGPFNTVQSSFIADFNVVYAGRGPESAYTNHGWWGRIWNVVWPY